MDLTRLGSLWRGEDQDPHAQATIIATMAVALKLIGRASSQDDAHSLAHQWWQARPPTPCKMV